jgi:hypothetical protein
LKVSQPPKLIVAVAITIIIPGRASDRRGQRSHALFFFVYLVVVCCVLCFYQVLGPGCGAGAACDKIINKKHFKYTPRASWGG